MAGSLSANSMSRTGPIIWTILPLFMRLLGGQSHLGGGDFQKFLRNVRLAKHVVFERQVLDELLGVVGRVLHRNHARAVLGGLSFEENLIKLEVQAVGKHRAQNLVRGRLENEFPRAAQRLFLCLRRRRSAPANGEWLDLADRKELPQLGPLDQGGNESGENNVHPVYLALGEQLASER